MHARTHTPRFTHPPSTSVHQSVSRSVSQARGQARPAFSQPTSQRHRCPAWQCDGVRERGRAQGLRCTCKQGRQQAKRKASIESGSLLPSTQNCRGPAKGGRGAGAELQTSSHLRQISSNSQGDRYPIRLTSTSPTTHPPLTHPLIRPSVTGIHACPYSHTQVHPPTQHISQSVSPSVSQPGRRPGQARIQPADQSASSFSSMAVRRCP